MGRRRRRSRGLGALSLGSTVAVWFAAGAAAGWVLTRALRSSDGAPAGLGAPFNRPTKAQIDLMRRQLVNRARPSAPIRPQPTMTVSDIVRAQKLDAYGDAAVYPGFDVNHPLFVATLQGSR
jgi:hypothetical protein